MMLCKQHAKLAARPSPMPAAPRVARPVVCHSHSTRREATLSLLGSVPLLMAAAPARAKDINEAKEERAKRKQMLDEQAKKARETGKGEDAFPLPDYSLPQEALSSRGAP